MPFVFTRSKDPENFNSFFSIIVTMNYVYVVDKRYRQYFIKHFGLFYSINLKDVKFYYKNKPILLIFDNDASNHH
jgi:hypothetical protein